LVDIKISGKSLKTVYKKDKCGDNHSHADFLALAMLENKAKRKRRSVSLQTDRLFTLIADNEFEKVILYNNHFP
jgi:hypothetical protein